MDKLKILVLLLFFLPLLLAPAWGKEISYEAFPYVLYDLQTGYEYGVLGDVTNLLQRDESFLLVLDFVENGGRSTAFNASFPDPNLRHGKIFPFAFDLETLTGKDVGDDFFGFGQKTNDNKYTEYDYDYNDLKLRFSRAIKPNVILFSELYFANNLISNLSQEADPARQVTSAMQALVRNYYIGSLGLEIDNRDDALNPQRGEDLSLKFDLSPKLAGSQASFARTKIDLRKYITLFQRDHVLAGRLCLTRVAGSAIPLYEYATLGGRDDLRAYEFFRFRGNDSALVNLEYRFPIIWNFGGVVFTDAGKVADSFSGLTLDDWAADVGVGLRLYLNNLVLRADWGVGGEGDSLYFYYNQLF